jgi:hypothetical protein
MGNNRASRSKTSAGTYAEALKSMRLNASRNVEAAINASKEHPLPKAPKGMRKGAEKQATTYFFDGILTALADSILEHAKPGFEMEMAMLMANVLVSKVNRASCGGEC